MTKIKKLFSGLFSIMFALVLGIGGGGVKTPVAKATTNDDDAFMGTVLEFLRDREEVVSSDTIFLFTHLIQVDDNLTLNPLYESFWDSFYMQDLPKLGIYNGGDSITRVFVNGNTRETDTSIFNIPERFDLSSDALTVVISDDYLYNIDDFPFDPPDYWIVKNPRGPEILPGPPPEDPPPVPVQLDGTIHVEYNESGNLIEETIFG